MKKEFIAKDGLFVPDYLSHGLHGGVWAKFELDVLGPDGKLLSHQEGPCRSFLRNFGRFWRQMLYVPDLTPEEFDDDTGVGRQFAIFDNDFAVGGNGEGPISEVAEFKVGDQSTAVSSTQDNVGLVGSESTTIMNFGTNGGGVDVLTTVIVENGTQAQWSHEATITNTGASFTVREIGLFARLNRGNALGQNDRCMMLRDVVADTVIPNGSSAVPKYTFTVAI